MNRYLTKRLYKLLSECIEIIDSDRNGFMSFNCIESIKEVRKQLCGEEQEYFTRKYKEEE